MQKSKLRCAFPVHISREGSKDKPADSGEVREIQKNRSQLFFKSIFNDVGFSAANFGNSFQANDGDYRHLVERYFYSLFDPDEALKRASYTNSPEFAGIFSNNYTKIYVKVV